MFVASNGDDHVTIPRLGPVSIAGSIEAGRNDAEGVVG